MSGFGLNLDLRVSQRQELRTVLSLQTIQSLKILQLATTDLQNLIAEEMLENPTLEMATTDPATEKLPEIQAQEDREQARADATPELKTEAGETYEEVYEYLKRNTDIDEFTSRSAKGGGRDGEPDAKQEAFANLPAPERQLSDHLLDQLRMREIDELDWPLLEQMVYSMDHRGYFEYPMPDIVKSLEGRYSLEEVEWALGVIQDLEPRGVGARDLAECLLLQINRDDPDYPVLERLLTVYWDDVIRNRIPRLSKSLEIDIDEVKLYLELLATLNPHPGAAYSSVARQIVVPDVVVEEDEQDVLQIKLTRENLPRLALSRSYLKMLEGKEADKETLAFVKNKISQAKQLIDAIDQRQSTLERVARSIVARQEGFMREGISALKPMKMQDIADELGIHHSTVWRAVYGKYMQTPQGVKAMNTFFTGGMPKGDGAVSREAVKLKLKEIVDAEDKTKPLSDMALAKALADGGIKASRRVVTKYRKEFGIPDSRVRRSY